MLWLGCLRITTVVGTHGLDRFHGERNKMCHTKHENRRKSVARPPATKSPFLLITNQNTTSPDLYRPNQPPDSGSVYESQRQQLCLDRCIAVTAIMLCVFLFESVLRFSVETSGAIDMCRRPKIFVEAAI